mmetsp:Transcript_7855/g.23165  ORF Transcript_7855/g.23165 Transcript_7855/m.23165 type:complete len:231 (-) Transcript_7855:184-876(-)
MFVGDANGSLAGFYRKNVFGAGHVEHVGDPVSPREDRIVPLQERHPGPGAAVRGVSYRFEAGSNVRGYLLGPPRGVGQSDRLGRDVEGAEGLLQCGRFHRYHLRIQAFAVVTITFAFALAAPQQLGARVDNYGITHRANVAQTLGENDRRTYLPQCRPVQSVQRLTVPQRTAHPFVDFGLGHGIWIDVASGYHPRRRPRRSFEQGGWIVAAVSDSDDVILKPEFAQYFGD